MLPIKSIMCHTPNMDKYLEKLRESSSLSDLIESWLSDTSGHDEHFWPELKNCEEINMNTDKEEIPLTFKNFVQKYGWPNIGSLRKMAFESKTNGLSRAFLKFGKRRLVLPKTLFKLIKGKKIS